MEGSNEGLPWPGLARIASPMPRRWARWPTSVLGGRGLCLVAYAALESVASAAISSRSAPSIAVNSWRLRGSGEVQP
jgi:hypothetical protein